MSREALFVLVEIGGVFGPFVLWLAYLTVRDFRPDPATEYWWCCPRCAKKTFTGRESDGESVMFELSSCPKCGWWPSHTGPPGSSDRLAHDRLLEIQDLALEEGDQTILPDHEILNMVFEILERRDGMERHTMSDGDIFMEGARAAALHTRSSNGPMKPWSSLKPF